MALLAWEMSAVIHWLAHSLVLPFLGIGMRIDFFQSCVLCWVFQVCWHNECKTLMASSCRDLNSSVGMSSHPLALLTSVLLKAHLTSHFRRLRVTNYTMILIWFIKIFLYSSSLHSFDLFFISSASCRSLPFLSFIVPIFGWNAPLIFPIFLKKSLVFPLCCFLLLLSIVHQRRPSCLFYGFPDSSVGKESACNAGNPILIPVLGRSAGGGIGYLLQYSWASLVAQLVTNPPAIRETWVLSLGWEDPLEKGKASHSSILAWRISWTVWGEKELDMTEWLSLSLFLSLLAIFWNSEFNWLYLSLAFHFSLFCYL